MNIAKIDRQDLATYHSATLNLEKWKEVLSPLIIRKECQKPTFIIKVTIKKWAFFIKPTKSSNCLKNCANNCFISKSLFFYHC